MKIYTRDEVHDGRAVPYGLSVPTGHVGLYGHNGAAVILSDEVVKPDGVLTTPEMMDLLVGEVPRQVIVDGVMTGTAVINGDAVDLANYSLCAFYVSWASTPNGAFTVEASVDGANWVDMGLSGLPTVAGAAGTGIVNVADIGFRYIRAVYTNSSTTGVLQAWVVVKSQ